MPMTRDERNARKRELRFQEQSARYRGFKSAYLEIWLKAKIEKLSFDWILAQRQSRVFDYIGKQRAPAWIQYKLEGIFDAFFELTFRCDVTYCYPHPQTGVITPAKVICDQGLAQELADKGLDKQGAHYWKNVDGSFTHTFN